jgi:hypothetical protein
LSRFGPGRQRWVRLAILALAVLTALAFISEGIVWWREYRVPS